MSRPHARGLTSSHLRLVSATSNGDKYHRMNKPFLPQNLVAGTKILLLRLVPRIQTDLNLWDKSLRLDPQNDLIDQPSLMPWKPHALCFESLFINFFLLRSNWESCHFKIGGEIFIFNFLEILISRDIFMSCALLSISREFFVNKAVLTVK